ncbi:hypothetical protein ACFLUK_01190 [Chloroflexota bacterium]
MAKVMVKILDPTVEEIKHQVKRLAPRVSGLRGKTIGLLDNRKPNAGVLLRAIGERLQREHGISGFLEATKWKSNMAVSQEVYDEFSQKCVAVITSTCD